MASDTFEVVDKTPSKNKGGRPLLSNFEKRNEAFTIRLSVTESVIADDLMDIYKVKNTSNLFQLLLQQDAVRQKTELKKLRIARRNKGAKQ